MMTSPVMPILLSYPTSLTGKKKKAAEGDRLLWQRGTKPRNVSFKDAGYS